MGDPQRESGNPTPMQLGVWGFRRRSPSFHSPNRTMFIPLCQGRNDLAPVVIQHTLGHKRESNHRGRLFQTYRFLKKKHTTSNINTHLFHDHGMVSTSTYAAKLCLVCFCFHTTLPSPVPSKWLSCTKSRGVVFVFVWGLPDWGHGKSD